MSLPKRLPEPDIKYMDFDIDELVAAAYNWCAVSLEGLDQDTINGEFSEEEMENVRWYIERCKEAKAHLAAVVEAFRPGFIADTAKKEREEEINQCLAL